MNTTEFLAQKIESTKVSRVSKDSTCLVMLTKLTKSGMFNVIGSRHDIELEHYNRVYLLDDPPVLAKDLEHGTVFLDGAGTKRCRILGHMNETKTKLFAPVMSLDVDIDFWLHSLASCTIVKGGG